MLRPNTFRRPQSRRSSEPTGDNDISPQLICWFSCLLRFVASPVSNVIATYVSKQARIRAGHICPLPTQNDIHVLPQCVVSCWNHQKLTIYFACRTLLRHPRSRRPAISASSDQILSVRSTPADSSVPSGFGAHDWYLIPTLSRSNHFGNRIF